MRSRRLRADYWARRKFSGQEGFLDGNGVVQMVGRPLRRTDVKFPYVSHAGPRFADIVKREELLDLKVPASPVPRGCVTKKVLFVLVCRCAKTKRNSTSIRRSGLKEDTGVFRTNVGGPVY